uniref:MHC class I-like antigen recognition-like domain-containing protein n=1 Tax=Junco hyemalis TaxID=40217 RepID=A0A8C5JTT3_JUNHY
MAGVLHSLHYLKAAVSEPSPGIPQYMITGFMDGIPFVRYDNERGRLEPLVQWIKDGAEPGYWEVGTWRGMRSQRETVRDLGTLQERYNQSGGVHTLLWVCGCDLLSDGSVRGFSRYSYDGRDLISFDLGSGRFVPADSSAEIIRRRWEQEEVAERRKNYLQHECQGWLRKYIIYGQKELERKGGSRIPVGIWDLGMEDLGTQILWSTQKWGKDERPAEQILQHHGPGPGNPNQFISGATEPISHFNGIIRLQAALAIITNQTAPAPDLPAEESTEMRNTTLNHRMGSDHLLAEGGGVCGKLNDSNCCWQIDDKGKVEKQITKETRKQIMYWSKRGKDGNGTRFRHSLADHGLNEYCFSSYVLQQLSSFYHGHRGTWAWIEMLGTMTGMETWWGDSHG